MNSFIPWVGGKKLLRNEICNRFPGNIERYIEVFGGAGWILFNKDKHAPFEVYNDINSNLVNLFRCIKHHTNAVTEEMQYMLNAREVFNTLKEMNTDNLTDIQRAVRYLYLIKASYGTKLTTFGAKARDIGKLDNIEDIKQRLKSVIIENKTYDELIKQYDRENALFYCDPPYFKAEKFYDTGNFIFDESQHIKLRNILCNVKGKFILSYNDCEFVRKLYADFKIEEVVRQNNLASAQGKNRVYKELIISNYEFV